MLTRDHVFGFLAGVGVSAVGFYLYKKNQAKVDTFLAGKGIKMPGAEAAAAQAAQLPMEDLVRQKEQLEDLIAERELAPKA